jgi:AcrR family transcriptional regulator
MVNYRPLTPQSREMTKKLAKLTESRRQLQDCGSPRARPRERIVATACDLFSRHGIRGIGVEAIAEAAGTNKMTLYRHFGSKDDLIVECLRKVANEAEAVWDELESACPGDKLAQLHGFVRRAADVPPGGGQGCDTASVAIELSEIGPKARRVIEEFKRARHDRLAKLCRAAGIVEAELLADTLSLLIEGARVSRQSLGAERSGSSFVRMSEVIIASFARR